MKVMTTAITAEEKLIKARTHLMMEKEFAFFGLLLMKTKFIEDNRMETLATDGRVIRFNSEFVLQLTMAETKGVLAHEIGHIFLGHVWRKGVRNHDDWNVAVDYITNEMVLKAGLTLPKGCLIDTQYDGLTSEETYRRIHEENQEQEEQDQQTGENADGDGQSTGQSQPDTDDMDNQEDQDSEDTDGQDDSSDTDDDTEDGTDSTGDGEDQDEQKDDGQDSSADGQEDQDYDGQYTDKGGCGGILEPADDEDDSDNLEAEWKEAISQAVQWSGTMPSGIREIVEKILNPPLPWTVILEDFIEYTARNDYNWNVPDSRFFSEGFILPSLISEELPEVVIYIDTSGSIDKRALAIFSEEASAVLATYDTTIRVIYCDDKVHGEEVFTKADLPMKLNPLGGGCTDFRPAFDYVEKKGYLPSCLIYFTDLYGDFPRQEPDYPVLWVTQTKTRKAPFGKTVLFQ